MHGSYLVNVKYMTGFIDKSAIIGKGFVPGFNVVVMEKAIIGDNVRIGHNSIIYPFTKISNNVEILDNAVIGKRPSIISTLVHKTNEPLSPCEIGEGSIIGTSTIIYAGTIIGKNCFISDLASIREKCVIKDHVIIGKAVTVEYEATIGEYSKIMTQCEITGNMVIEDHVFFGAAVVSVNDKYMGRTGNQFDGPRVKSWARVGANATILAGVTIGKEAVVGAGAVVTRDIADYKFAMGIPARVVKDVPLDQRLHSGTE
jgi:UDP-2-acetamido-3-amino-2,3-dideoxy-glucuronate N-acetyltransferase